MTNNVNDVIETEIYSDVTVAAIANQEDFRQVCQSKKVIYEVPAIEEGTRNEVSLTITNTCLFNENVCENKELLDSLMNVSSNIVVLHHFSRSVQKGMEEKIKDNPEAMSLYQRIQERVLSIHGDLIQLTLMVNS